MAWPNHQLSQNRVGHPNLEKWHFPGLARGPTLREWATGPPIAQLMNIPGHLRATWLINRSILRLMAGHLVGHLWATLKYALGHLIARSWPVVGVEQRCG